MRRIKQREFESCYAALPAGTSHDVCGEVVEVERRLVIRHGITLTNAEFHHLTPDATLEIRSQDDGRGHQRGVLEKCRIVGHRGTGIGLIVASPNVRLRDVFIEGAGCGLELRRLAFLFAAEGCVIKRNQDGVGIDAETYMRGKGENISFHHCSISGNAIDGFRLTRARVALFACSVDYNGRHGVTLANRAELKSFGSHFETEVGREHVFDSDGTGEWIDFGSKIHKIDHRRRVG